MFFAALAVVTFAALAAVAWPWAQGILAAPPSEDFTLAALEVKGLRLLNGDDILEASGKVTVLAREVDVAQDQID